MRWHILNGSVQGPAKSLNQDWTDWESTPTAHCSWRSPTVTAPPVIP